MSNDIVNSTTLAPVISAAITRNNAIGDKNVVRPEPVSRAAASPLPLPLQKPDNQKLTAEVSPEELQRAVKQGNHIFQMEQRDLQINIDDETNRVVVKIIDRASGDVIRQMPTKDVLDFVKQMQKQVGSTGALFKNSA
jgi:flagellar protein FlaG